MTTPGTSGWRRTGAVAAGLATIVVVSSVLDGIMHGTGLFPPMGQPMPAGSWWLAVAYRALVTVAGGWIASRLDPARGMRSAWILTGLGVVLGLVGVGVSVANPQLGPGWYAWAVALSGPPACWLGGRLGARGGVRG